MAVPIVRHPRDGCHAQPSGLVLRHPHEVVATPATPDQPDQPGPRWDLRIFDTRGSRPVTPNFTDIYQAHEMKTSNKYSFLRPILVVWCRSSRGEHEHERLDSAWVDIISWWWSGPEHAMHGYGYRDSQRLDESSHRHLESIENQCFSGSATGQVLVSKENDVNVVHCLDTLFITPTNTRLVVERSLRLREIQHEDFVWVCGPAFP